MAEAVDKQVQLGYKNMCRSHRLEAQDTALSRRRHGFDSRWDYQKGLNVLIFSRKTFGEARTFALSSRHEQGLAVLQSQTSRS